MANTSAFQAEDAGSIPVVPSFHGRPNCFGWASFIFPPMQFPTTCPDHSLHSGHEPGTPLACTHQPPGYSIRHLWPGPKRPAGLGRHHHHLHRRHPPAPQCERSSTHLSGRNRSGMRGTGPETRLQFRSRNRRQGVIAHRYPTAGAQRRLLRRPETGITRGLRVADRLHRLWLSL